MNFDGFNLVFCNGDAPARSRLQRLIPHPVRVVCADGGAQKATAAGYTPDLIVGDLDSLSDEKNFPVTTEIVKIPSQNNTDFEKTLDLMLARGMDGFLVAAFAGGRIDQTLANILIAYEYSSKCRIALADDEYLILPTRAILEESLERGTILSLIAMTDEAVVTTFGLAYGMNRTHLPKGGFGVSNKTVDRKVKIVVHSGGILTMIKYA